MTDISKAHDVYVRLQNIKTLIVMEVRRSVEEGKEMKDLAMLLDAEKQLRTEFETVVAE